MRSKNSFQIIAIIIGGFIAWRLGLIALYVLAVLGYVGYQSLSGMRKKDADKRSNDYKSRTDAALEASKAALVGQQEELENAEAERKAKNPVISLTEFFTNQRNFRPVTKYSIEYVNLGGVYYQTKDIDDVAFYADNKFSAEGKVLHGSYLSGFGSGVYHFAKGGGSAGRRMTTANGFQILLEVNIQGTPVQVYVNILHDVKPQEESAPQGGYKTAVSPYDVFDGKMGVGAKIKVTGDFFRRIHDSRVLTEYSDNRWIQPAGYYIVCRPDDVVFL